MQLLPFAGILESMNHNLKHLILDMDGVLWRGETPMPGLERLFATLKDLNVGYVLATNNATKVATQYAAKLARFGVEVPPERILTSAEATASHLRQLHPAGTSAYVVGEDGLRRAMGDAGFDVIVSDGFVGQDARAELVVIGFNRHVCYGQLASAAHLVNHGAQFVGTNPDVTFPSEVGPLPGAGSLLAFVQAATGATPTIIGKPGRAIFNEALGRLDARPEQTAMVGDRLETDIRGAKDAGLRTILLLSGVTSRKKAEQSQLKPDLILDDISALADYFIGCNDD